MPDVARGPLLLSLGLGAADGILRWIRLAGFRVSLADVGGHGDVHCDGEGFAIGMKEATSEQSPHPLAEKGKMTARRTGIRGDNGT
uniref:Uncharacterized protein n=1 Tax=Leersia perrieri TaxID=77586 RepID=A0A0D9VAR4_9ORYZ